jgi:hypothetical protein
LVGRRPPAAGEGLSGRGDQARDPCGVGRRFFQAFVNFVPFVAEDVLNQS